MNVLINYAHGCCKLSRRKNSISGLEQGFDCVIEWKREHLDSEFIATNSSILNSSRGAGYWLWKPYIIKKTLEKCNEGDVVFYADAASFFVRDMTPIFDTIRKNSVVCFELSGGHIEGKWTRRNVFDAIGMDADRYKNTYQRMASFIGVMNCEHSRSLIDEYLKFCCIPELIMDMNERDPNENPEFYDHRHDQSIWSLLCKKNEVHVLKDPTQWGVTNNETTNDDVFIIHTRDKR